MPAGQFKIVHVGGAALLICLYAAGSAKSLSSRWVHFALAAVAAGIIGYVFGQHDLLTSKRAFLPQDMDLVVAWAFLLLCLYARSEGRGVGNEGVGTGRYGGSPYDYKKRLIFSL